MWLRRDRRLPQGQNAPVYDGDDRWRAWYERSPVALDLAEWLNRPSANRQAVGDVGYRDRLVALLNTASPRDCAAAGMGCTRRSDRSCPQPQVCMHDPEHGMAERMQHSGGVGWRQGPLPGGCDRFCDANGYVWAHFSTDDGHRAVLWTDEFLGAVGSRTAPLFKRLWVDGKPIPTRAQLDRRGYWVANRWFTIQLDGADSHPLQQYGAGVLVTRIRSLLMHDARGGDTTVYAAGPTESWTEPSAAMMDGALCIFADRQARDARRPSRTITVA